MDKKPLNESYEVRAAQAVLQYGVGAMVDFPDQTLMTAAPEFWANSIVKIHDPRLEKLLGVDYFGMPCNEKERTIDRDAPLGESGVFGISYVRFPTWYFCPCCKRLMPLSKWIKEYLLSATPDQKKDDPYMLSHMRCTRDRQPLVVSRFITVCEQGHIDDFPWVDWVHCRNIGGEKEICSDPQLKIITGESASEGLEGIFVECERCKARASLKGAFDKRKQGSRSIGILEDLQTRSRNAYDFSCKCKHPWKHSVDSNVGRHFPNVSLRGSSSVYFPVTASSLVINDPQVVASLTDQIRATEQFKEFKANIAHTYSIAAYMTEDGVKRAIEDEIEKTSRAISSYVIARTTPTQIADILRGLLNEEDENKRTTSSVDYRAEEYVALSGEIPLSEDEDFLREATDISEYHIPFVKQISLIHKMREVQALIGFSRLRPVDKTEAPSRQGQVVNIKNSETKWYPAYEVRGEGIFIDFDTNAINAWERKNPAIAERVQRLNDNYAASFMGASHSRRITARFLLLHTIAHLLIRQLSFECGYSIASLRERIYCGDNGVNEKNMAGILLYTASGDSEGTLGGLVRQGRADSFPRIFKKAIENAVTCSNDPVCSLSQGQGRDSLNLAACYSCTLIPETSCEEFNLFLDRGTVVGTFDKRDIGFYSKQVYSDEKWGDELLVENDSNAFNEERESEPQERESYSIFPQIGINNAETSFDQMVESLLAFSENEHEKRLLSDLMAKASIFSEKEKPQYDGLLTISGQADEYSFSLLWVKSRVILFSETQREAYEMAKQSDWRCFYSCDPDLSADLIAQAVQEE